ncbi:MAG: hypothetical protein IJO50_01130, partial [Clostridia bacterium]|nr:hypothetical protein [Clostridia bacterium]
MKKFLALMLSVLLVLTLVPVMAVEEPQLVIEMFDSVPDTWDGAYIEIYANGQLWQTVEKGNGEESQTETFPYDPDVVYEFYWVQGGYDQEISFTVSFGGVEQYSCENAGSELLNGALFLEYWENPCEHKFAAGSCLCTECGRTCGEDFPHDFSEEHVCSICSYACGSEATPHDWSKKDGICGVCAYACPGHEYVDNVCVLCGLPKSIVIQMEDSAQDTWDGAYIEIYADGELWQTVKKKDTGSLETASYPYDPEVLYDFYWFSGEFDQEITFTISFSGTEQFSHSSADEELTNQEKFFTYWENPCEHSFADGSCLCTACGKTCGEDFPHEFSEEHICSICSYACGSEETPHDWSKKDGVCGVCAGACPGHEFVDHVCSI